MSVNIEELKSLISKATPGPWCAVVAPDGTDPAEYHYGYGELRTQPTEKGGWQLIVKVDEHDEHDDDLRFIAAARTALPELIEMYEREKAARELAVNLLPGLRTVLDAYGFVTSVKQIDEALQAISEKVSVTT